MARSTNTETIARAGDGIAFEEKPPHSPAVSMPASFAPGSHSEWIFVVGRTLFESTIARLTRFVARRTICCRELSVLPLFRVGASSVNYSSGRIYDSFSDHQFYLDGQEK